MPTLVATPWPSGPVVVSTPEVQPYSGWPGQRLPAWRKCLMSSSVTAARPAPPYDLGAAADAGEVDQRIQQHRGVTGGQHEAVAVHPVRVGRVVAQITLPQRVGGRRGIHRRARMPGLCLLDGIGRSMRMVLMANWSISVASDILVSWLPWEGLGSLEHFPIR